MISDFILLNSFNYIINKDCIKYEVKEIELPEYKKWLIEIYNIDGKMKYKRDVAKDLNFIILDKNTGFQLNNSMIKNINYDSNFNRYSVEVVYDNFLNLHENQVYSLKCQIRKNKIKNLIE